MSHHIQKGGIFSREITEKSIQKWRMVQFVAILPLLVPLFSCFASKARSWAQLSFS